MEEQWENKVAVVTGASAGIGLVIAQTLVLKGMTVIGLARRKEKMLDAMRDVKGNGTFYAYKCDVSNGEDVSEAFNWIKESFGVLHVLINNAGIALPGNYLETNRSDWQRVFDVNVMGLLDCMKRAITIMKEADVKANIININSVEGHAVFAFDGFTFNVYPASKFAVTAATEIAQQDVHDSKIRITSLSPGLVATDILKANNFKTDISKLPFLQSEDIANAVLYIINTPQRVHITELTIRPLGEVHN